MFALLQTNKKKHWIFNQHEITIIKLKKYMYMYFSFISFDTALFMQTNKNQLKNIQNMYSNHSSETNTYQFAKTNNDWKWLAGIQRVYYTWNNHSFASIPFSSSGGVWFLLSHPQSSFQIHLLVIYPQGTAWKCIKQS